MKLYKRNDTLYIVPETDLVASQVELLRDTILKKLKNETSLKQIVLNVKGIEIIDSLGVNLIVGTFKQGEALSAEFKIINAGEKFIKISDFFQFTEFFTVLAENNKDD